MKDMLQSGTVFTGCIALGLAINDIRASPLPLIYVSPQTRLNAVIDKLQSPNTVVRTTTFTLNGDVTLNEMKQISLTRSVTILDARPEVFYKLGHIPNALSLPRDDFEIHYKNMESQLSPFKNKLIVVYCSGGACEDSKLVAEALEKLGYSYVRVFKGGWEEWDNTHQQEDDE